MRLLFPLWAACLPAAASLSLPKLAPATVRYAALSAPSSSAPALAAEASGPAAEPAGREALLALARKGLLDSARATALKSLSARPDDAFLLLLLGKLSPSGQESAEYLKKAIKAGGNSPEAEEALFRLGQYTYATGKYPFSIPYFRDYLARFPQGGWRDPAMYWMGNACLALARSRGDKADYLDSSETWFRRLMEGTKPGEYYRPLALEGLAKALAGKGDRDGAWLAASEALGQAPEEEKPSLLLLAAQTRQGADRAAEKSLMARLAAEFPQSPEARYLRKLNAGADTSRWRSGSGLPRPLPQPARDSAAAQGNPKATETGTLPPERPHAARPVPAPGDSAAKPFTLQCGAFTQAANAQAMATALSKLGLAPETVERDHGGKRIFQVRVGRFGTAEEADAFARDRLKPQRILSQAVPANP